MMRERALDAREDEQKLDAQDRDDRRSGLEKSLRVLP